MSDSVFDLTNAVETPLPVEGGVPMEDAVDMTAVYAERAKFEALPDWAKRRILALEKRIGDLNYDHERETRELRQSYLRDVPYRPAWARD